MNSKLCNYITFSTYSLTENDVYTVVKECTSYEYGNISNDLVNNNPENREIVNDIVNALEVSKPNRLSIDELELKTPKELGQILYHLISQPYNYPDINYLKDLINCGAWVNYSEGGYKIAHTPLLSASYHGRVKIVKLLIKNGAALHPIDIWGNTPLHWAAHWNRRSTVKFLIDSGALKTIKNYDDETAWDFASESLKKYIPELNPDFCDNF